MKNGVVYLLRAGAAGVVVWYLALLAFQFYPYCTPGSDPSGATCYWGHTDFGVLYHNVFYFSISFGILIAAVVLVMWARVEWLHRHRASA